MLSHLCVSLRLYFLVPGGLISGAEGTGVHAKNPHGFGNLKRFGSLAIPST